MEIGAALPLLSHNWVDTTACRAELVLVRTLRGMLDAHEARVTARLGELTPCPEAMVADVNQTGLGAAGRITARSTICESMPALADALANGDTTGGHIDAVASAVRGLSPDQQLAMTEHAERLARDAARLPRREFEQRVKGLVATVTGDDGLDRLARQKRARRLSLREGSDGMWRLRGDFDPESAAILQARLTRQVETMFHTGPPDDAPRDPWELQDHLRALALLALVDGDAVVSRGADVSVVIDATTLLDGSHEGSRLEVGEGGFDLPVETIRRWACLGEVTPFVVGQDGTRLFVGRTQRLANREQRRALRVRFATCRFCPTPFDRCEIHHVHWFRHGGSTDIDNLIPICSRHHHLVHEGGATIELHDDGSISLVLPDGTRQTHAPPTIRAA